jgi:hypothetical protein
MQNNTEEQKINQNDEEFIIDDAIKFLNIDISHTAQDRKWIFMSIFRLLLNICNESSANIKKHCIRIILYTCIEYKDILLLNPKLTNIVKKKIDEFITVNLMTDLISMYNLIFNDNLYDNNIKHDDFTITQEVKDSIMSDYLALTLPSTKITKKRFSIGEIVGAKDKENHWWMAKILYHAYHDGKHIYYVEFLNWGKEFNEFICDGHRLQKFNKYKHNYYRSAVEQANCDNDVD